LESRKILGPRVNEVYLYALQILRRRDYTVSDLTKKVAAKFHQTPQHVIDELIRKNFLNDRRFAQNYAARRKDRGPAALREELESHGVRTELIDEVLSQTEWPSLRDALATKMGDWNLRAPLQSRDATRLFRALLRLGYDEDAIREEIGQHSDEQ
jgi:SOS response regulatory protein OraA/RecX